MKAEIEQMMQLYKEKYAKAKEQRDSHHKRYQDHRVKLQKISETITVVSTTKVPKIIKRKHCLKNIEGFSRTVKRYKCVPSDQEDEKAVCSGYKVINNKVECYDTEVVGSAKTCETFEQHKDGDKFVCTKEIRVWPKGKCTKHFTHNNRQYCGKLIFLQPRFFCEKYAVLKGMRYCIQVITIFGKKYHVFICIKTGKEVKTELMDTGLGGPEAVKEAQKEEERTVS